jgi:uncharacterized membrane protein
MPAQEYIMNSLHKNWPIIALAAIALLGLLLRLHNLDWQCLKVDELVTRWAAMQTTESIVRWALSVDYNPPLYYLLAHWSSVAFGEVTRFSLRFPALICGSLAIPAAYYFGKEVKGNTLGLLLASLISFMFPFYYYSQDARAYPLVLLCFICFSYFWVKLYKGEFNLETIAGTSIFAALCLWSHYYSALPILLLGIFLLLKYKYKSKMLFVITPTVLLTLPLVLLFDIKQFATRTNYALFDVFWLTPQWMSTLILNELFCWSWVIVVPLMVYSLIKYKSGIIRIFAFVGTITALLLIPFAQVTAILPRYAILVSPLLLLVAIYPIAEMIDAQPSTAKKMAVFWLVIFIFITFNIQSIVMWNTFDTCPLMVSTSGAL